VKERPIHSDFSFISNNQASKITDPRKGSFHLPSFLVTPQLPAVLGFSFFPIASVWCNQIYFKCLKPLAKRIAVIAFISNQSRRSFFGATFSPSWNSYRIKGFFSELYFSRRCRGKGASQRNTLAVDHHHPLCSLALFGFPDARAPFFAGAKLPSIKASSQSSAPFSSSMERNLRQISSHIPKSSHNCSRRQQIDGLGYRSGKSCQRAPVRKTQRMPSKTWRLSQAGRPPCGFCVVSGSSGSNSFHCSSFMKGLYLAIGVTSNSLIHKSIQKSIL